MEEKKLIGYHKFFSKKRNCSYLVVDVVCRTTGRDLNNGYVGDEKVEQIFIPENLWTVIEDTPNIIGKTLIFDYELNGRYCNLCNICLKK